MALGAPIAKTATGSTVTLATPSATENITTSGALELYISNSAGAGTVTITDPGKTPSGNSAQNPVISVGAGVTKIISLPASLINPANGQIQLVFAVGTFSGVLFIA